MIFDSPIITNKLLMEQSHIKSDNMSLDKSPADSIVFNEENKSKNNNHMFESGISSIVGASGVVGK